MFRKPYFGTNISPACEYCAHSRPSPDGRMYYCLKVGVVYPYHKCRKFRYDPLRRIPRRRPALPKFSPEDFQL